MAKENTGVTTDYTVTAREIDFVTQFEHSLIIESATEMRSLLQMLNG